MNASWNLETIRRYWAVGKRLRDPEIVSLINAIEVHFARNSFIDGISTLRTVVGATETVGELKVVLQTLFMEQRARLRRGVSLAGTGRFVFHAMLLRPVLLSYLRDRFPKFTQERKFLMPYMICDSLLNTITEVSTLEQCL